MTVFGSVGTGRFSAVGLAMRLGSFCGLAVAESRPPRWVVIPVDL